MFQLSMSTGKKTESTMFQQNVFYTIKNGDLVDTDATTTNDTSNQSTLFKIPHAPPHVYSFFVVNRTAELIECTLKHDGHPGEQKSNQMIDMTIPANSENYFS